MAVIALVQELLRSPDEVKAVLEATLVTSPDHLDNDAPNPRRDAQNRRVLAVVSHKDDWDLTEEGCLFICKHKPTTDGQQPEELDVQRVLPVYGDFGITMSQLRRGTGEFRPPTPGLGNKSKLVLEQPQRTGLSLTITPAEGLQPDVQPPTFYTHDVQGLKDLITECKRLKEVSDVDANAVINLAQSTTHFSWLKPYFTKRTTIAALTSMLQDLRHINRPLLERLSPACAGQTSDDLADIQVMRDDWIRIKAQEMSREGRRALTLRLGTFNVNGKMPSQDLSAWVQGNTGYNKVGLNASLEPPTLPLVKNMSPLSLGEVMRNPFDWITRAPKSSSKLEKEENKEEVTSRVDLEDPEDPDLFVFGFQELDLSTEALIYSTSTLREDAWCHAIFAALGEKASKYEKLASRQLVGMLILVIVKQGLKDCFGEVKTASAGAGILGVMGNKGGTAVRLAFTPPVASKEGKTIVGSPGSTTLTFVNAHLAAFDEMVDKRNLDFHDLSKRLAFENTTPNNSFSPALSDQGSDNGNIVNETGISAMGTTPPLSVYETDALFWMGDLNYRVDIPDLDMRRLLRDDEWDNGSKFEALLRFDQLKKAMQANKAFAGFQEFKVAHMPTYRFSPGLAMDKLGYDIKRKPAWTDRILYMHGPFCKVNQVSYTSHPQIMMSDHRPVAADFVVDVGHYDTEVHQQNVYKLFNDVTELDGEGAHQRGGLKVEDTFVDFDKIYHGKPVERKLLVKNVGKSPYAFRFVPIQVDSPIHPEWLQIHPMAGVLLPDEVTEIILRAYVDDATASILNLRPKDLSGTLILHTVLGKDHFISVSGEYQYTCFANKLSRLTRLRGSIRSMESPNDILPENNPINAPREVMRLVNWMMSSTANDGMFVSPGDETIVDEIRECLDTGAEFPYSASASDPRISVAFASTLLRFLDALPEPIIPASLHPQCIDMSNRDEAFELLDALPPASVNVWISVTAFLHFICQSSATEQMAVQIAVILAPILLKDDPNSPITPISPKAKSQFLLYFIT